MRRAMRLAGRRCAFPNCSSPKALDNGIPLLEIAHISTLVPGGPRYIGISDSRTNSLGDNIIVLCPTHHVAVDREPDTYTVDALLRMREEHLQRVDSLSTEPVPAINRLAESLSVWEKERGNDSEEFWHAFFTEHPEVLSITMGGRAYTLLGKCYVGGKSVSNSGGNVLDFLAQNSGNCALLEIKTPSARLLSSSPYRNNAFAPSRELSGSCVQILTYKESLMRELTNLTFSAPALRAISPSCTVIIGDLSAECMGQNARHSFEVFRSALKDVRVLTYDELFEGIRGLINALS